MLADAFRRDGAVLVKQALDRRTLDLAREAFEYTLDHPSRHAYYHYPERTATFYQDFFNMDAWPSYGRLLGETRVADIIADLWRSAEVWFFCEQIFFKEGGDARRTPWHQDATYLPIAGNDLAVMWISLDAVAPEHALEFIPGSHRGTLYNGTTFNKDDDTDPLYPSDGMVRLPDIEADRGRWDIRSWPVEPGDVVVFHPAVLHGGAPVPAGKRRRTISLRFFGSDAVHTEQPWRVLERQLPAERRDPMHRVYDHLSPGDPFRSPIFRKLRPAGPAGV